MLFVRPHELVRETNKKGPVVSIRMRSGGDPDIDLEGLSSTSSRGRAKFEMRKSLRGQYLRSSSLEPISTQRREANRAEHDGGSVGYSVLYSINERSEEDHVHPMFCQGIFRKPPWLPVSIPIARRDEYGMHHLQLPGMVPRCLVSFLFSG